MPILNDRKISEGMQVNMTEVQFSFLSLELITGENKNIYMSILARRYYCRSFFFPPSENKRKIILRKLHKCNLNSTPGKKPRVIIHTHTWSPIMVGSSTPSPISPIIDEPLLRLEVLNIKPTEKTSHTAFVNVSFLALHDLHKCY